MTRESAAGGRRPVRRWLARWSPWVHTYLSMFGLAAILFFSATGLTLNHPEWFFEERTVQLEGRLPVEWLHVEADPPSGWDGVDYSHEVEKLEVAGAAPPPGTGCGAGFPTSWCSRTSAR